MSEALHESTTRSSRQLPRSVWILSIVSFLADVSSEMVYPLLPLFLVSVMGSSKMQLGAMEGGAALIVALMSAFAGIRSAGREQEAGVSCGFAGDTDCRSSVSL